MHRYLLGICLAAAVLGATQPAGAARIAVLFSPELRPHWLASDEARHALIQLLRQHGHEVQEHTDMNQWPALLDPTAVDLVIYGPCEAVLEALVQPLRDYVHNGGRLITGGGAAAFNVAERRGDDFVVIRSRATAEVFGVATAFTSGEEPVELTQFGRRIFGDVDLAHSEPFARGLTAGREVEQIPLIRKGIHAPASILSYSGGGRLVHFGDARPIEQTLLNPLDEAGRQRWGRLVDAVMQPLPQIAERQIRRTHVIGDDRAARLAVRLSNPAPQTLDGNAHWRLAEMEGEEVFRHAQPFRIPAGGETAVQVDVPLPQEPRQWGFYPVRFETDGGVFAEKVLHLLPPAAAAYIDVDRLFVTDGDLTIRIGIHRFSRQAVRGSYVVEESDQSMQQWHRVDSGEVDLAQHGVHQKEFQLPVPPQDTIYRLTFSIGGAKINDEYVKFERGPRRAQVRPENIGRSLDGRQVTDEPEFFSNTNRLREQLPLLTELSLHTNNAEVIRRAREHNYDVQVMLHTVGPDGRRWGLQDRGPNGENPYEGWGQQHQGEDKTLWIAAQVTRQRMKAYAERQPDRILYIEPVTGYDVTGGMGEYGSWFGYTDEAVQAYRLALAGRDAGIRVLAPDGQRVERWKFADVYRLVFNEPLPNPRDLGFASWQKYEPYRIPRANAGGRFGSEREILGMRLHLWLRIYFNLWQLDQASAFTRCFVPEIQMVPNSDGPRNGQFTHLFYRLPYIDTIQKQMFRTAFGWAITSYRGDLTWGLLGETYGKRIRLREEIGSGGGTSPYRTPETSFVSVFTKRSVLPGRCFEQHFYTWSNLTFRVREEVGNMAAYSMAHDLGTRRFWGDERDLLFVNVNRIYYAENFRGFPGHDPANPQSRPITAIDSLRFHGIETDMMELPFPRSDNANFLAQYRTIVLDAVAQPAGTFEVLRHWLNGRGEHPRTLVLNHINHLHLSTAGGAAPEQLAVRKPDNWRALGLPARNHQLIRTNAFRLADGHQINTAAQIPIFHVAAPPGARVLLSMGDDRAVIWQLPRPNGNSIIYSGLPLNYINVAGDPDLFVEQTWVRLINDYLGHPQRITSEPMEPFASLYRTADGLPILAVISDEEPRVTAPSMYHSEEELMAVVNQIPQKTVTITIRSMPPGRSFVPWDITRRGRLGDSVTATAAGELQLVVPLHLAKLIALVPADRNVEEEAQRFEPYLIPWLPNGE